MDYYCGGDLLTLLSKFEDRLPEDMARLVSEVLGVARGILQTSFQTFERKKFYFIEKKHVFFKPHVSHEFPKKCS